MSSSGVDGSESALLSAAGYLTTAAQEVLSTVSTTVSTPTLGSVWDDGSQRRVWPESDAVADGDGNRTGFADGAVDAILTTALEAFRITLEECRREALHYGTYDLPKLCAGKLQKVANLESSLILGPEKHGTSSLVPGAMWNDMMTRNSSNFTEEVVAGGELSLDNLYPAVVECFFVIICGYLAGRANFISTSDAKGLNTFVGTFALPALIFNSMAALDFSSVNWTFLFSISISKALVFALVVFVTILVERPIDFGKAGLFAIFCTQSNDFALGYPIIASLYRNSYPEFPSYLYLVAPISLVFLNPIGFVLMEYQKRRDRVKRGEVDSLQKSNFVLALDIFTGVSLNPVVLMTALGIAGNYAFGHRLPSILEGILKVLSSAYSATALFVLGLRLVGSVQRVSGAAFVVPAILIMTKGLVLPLITREIVDNMQPGATANETTAYSNYGFLYGTVPTAPTVFVYAAQFNIQADMIASAMVIGTFLSALVMFVSAKMVTLTNVVPQDYAVELNGFLFNVAALGAISCAAVVVVFSLTRKWQKMPHFVTLCLALSQMMACVGVLTWALVDSNHQWKLYLQFFIFSWGVFASRIWTALLAVTLVFMRIRSLRDSLKLRRYLPIIGWGLPAIIVGILLGIVAGKSDMNLGTQPDPTFQYGPVQAIASLVVLSTCFLVTLLCLILQQRLKRLSAEQKISWNVYEELYYEGSVSMSEMGDDYAGSLGSSERNPERKISEISDSSSMASSTPTTPTSDDIFSEAMKRSISRQTSKIQLIAFDASNDAKNDAILFSPSDELNPRQAKQAKDIRHSPKKLFSFDNFLRKKLKMREESLQIIPEDRVITSSMSIEDGKSTASSSSFRDDWFNSTRRNSGTLAGSTTSLQKNLQNIVPMSPLQPEETGILRDRDDEYQILRHVVLLLILLTSMLVGLSLCLWSIVIKEKSGIYVEMVFFDVALNFGQGLFVFLIFGLDQKLVIAPLLRKFRRCYYGTSQVLPPPPEKLSPETIHVCQQFVDYHMDKCARDIVRDRRFRSRFYKQAFCGNELVDWLLIVGLAPDRKHATKYGRRLLAGRLLRHYDNEHNFHDMPFFYTFCQAPRDASSVEP